METGSGASAPPDYAPDGVIAVTRASGQTGHAVLRMLLDRAPAAVGAQT